MKFIFTCILAIGVWGYSYSQIITQEIYAVGGDYFSQINGSLDWTMGEFMIDTYTNGSNFLTQGFHQGSEEAVISIVEVFQNTTYKAYPNPTTGELTIAVSGLTNENVNREVQILDIAGKILKKETWQHTNTIKLDLSEYATGYYLIRVLGSGSQKPQLYKIQKIK